MEEYKLALHARPDFQEGYTNIGLIYKEQGLWREASGAFKEALNLDPFNKFALFNLAGCLAKLKRLDEAEKELIRIRDRVDDLEYQKVIDSILEKIKSG